MSSRSKRLEEMIHLINLRHMTRPRKASRTSGSRSSRRRRRPTFTVGLSNSVANRHQYVFPAITPRASGNSEAGRPSQRPAQTDDNRGRERIPGHKCQRAEQSQVRAGVGPPKKAPWCHHCACRKPLGQYRNTPRRRSESWCLARLQTSESALDGCLGDQSQSSDGKEDAAHLASHLVELSPQYNATNVI